MLNSFTPVSEVWISML